MTTCFSTSTMLNPQIRITGLSITTSDISRDKCDSFYDTYKIEKNKELYTETLRSLFEPIDKIGSLVTFINSYVHANEFINGESIDDKLFTELRSSDIYCDNFDIFIINIEENSKMLLLYYLSNLDYNFVYPFELDFIIDVLKNGNVTLQEMALQTIENWNNFDFFARLVGLQLKNAYLQDDLEALIGT